VTGPIACVRVVKTRFAEATPVPRGRLAQRRGEMGELRPSRIRSTCPLTKPPWHCCSARGLQLLPLRLLQGEGRGEGAGNRRSFGSTLTRPPAGLSPREKRDRRRCRQAAHVVPNRGACMAFVHVFVPWADRRKRQGFPRSACLASCSGRLVPHATSRRCGFPGRPRDSPSRSRSARLAAAPPGGPGRRCRARGSPARSYGRPG